jgi:hypothetical protein
MLPSLCILLKKSKIGKDFYKTEGSLFSPFYPWSVSKNVFQFSILLAITAIFLYCYSTLQLLIVSLYLRLWKMRAHSFFYQLQ